MMIKRVLVVGGGISGLAMARGLTRAGISCVVVERSKEWQPAGAGIILSVNAMAALDRLGLAKPLEDRGFRLGRGAITTADGRELSVMDFGTLEAKFGPTLSIHRAALHAVLLEGASEAEILLDTSIESITEQSNGVNVRLSNGQQDRFDLVVGADGIGSRVRELCFGEVQTAYSGYTCWRFVVEADLTQSTMCEMWGRGKRFGVVPMGEDQFYIYAVANAERNTPDSEPGQLERFRARFSEFGGPVPTILSALDGASRLIHNDLSEIHVDNWFRERVVLVGDAAHAMTPNMGQGAAMALEDAAVLIELIQTAGPLSKILESYQTRRQARVDWVQSQSRRIGQIGQFENPLACRLRNALVKLVPNHTSTHALRRLASKPI
jgi:2-polyprenyl-6-methoxyphenol hydroxylase-like FAD-dependent oxidoreductase